MSVAQTQAPSSREMFRTVDTCLSPHTLTLKTLGQTSWALFLRMHRMFVKPDAYPQTSREMFWATDTGLSRQTLSLQDLGQIAEDAYHVRRLDACPIRAGRFPEDAYHVRQPDAYQNKQGDVLGERTQVASCTRLAKQL